MNYRKIWTDAFGPIPKDENGRSYEIHHIDGNRDNNALSNLTCVTIQEHYDIHYSQKDWEACRAIGIRLKYTVEELSEIYAEISKLKTGVKRNLGKRGCKFCGKLVGVTNIAQHERQCKSNPDAIYIPKPWITNKSRVGNKYKSGIKKPNVSKGLLSRKKIKCTYCPKEILDIGENVLRHISTCKYKK